jgi:hypothetical protein
MSSKRVPPPPPGFPALSRRYSITKTEPANGGEEDSKSNGDDEEWNPIKFGANIISSISGSDLMSPKSTTTANKTSSSSASDNSLMGTMNTIATGLYDTVLNVTSNGSAEVNRRKIIDGYESVEASSQEKWIEFLNLIIATPLPLKSSVEPEEAQDEQSNFRKQEEVWFRVADNNNNNNNNNNSSTSSSAASQDYVDDLFNKITLSRWKSLQPYQFSGGDGNNEHSSKDPLHESLYTLIQHHGICPRFRRKLWSIWSGSLELRYLYEKSDNTLANEPVVGVEPQGREGSNLTDNCEASSSSSSSSSPSSSSIKAGTSYEILSDMSLIDDAERELFVDVIEKDVNRTCREVIKSGGGGDL